MARIKSSLLDNILFYEILLVLSLTILSISVVPGLFFLFATLITAIILPYIFKDPEFNAIDVIGEKSKAVFHFFSKKIAFYNELEMQKLEQKKQVQEQENVDTSPSYQPINEFKLKKKGRVINICIFIFGALPLFYAIYVISDLMGINLFDETSIWVLITGILAINSFYYLPTFLYYSGNAGKIIVFLLNVLVSWTLIGWSLLLFFVISQNNKYRHQNELIHVMKQYNIHR